MTRKISLLFALMVVLRASDALAAPVTFFGVDLNVGNTVPAGGNAVTARNNLLSNLSGVRNEDFTSVPLGLLINPLTLSFPGSSGNLSATLTLCCGFPNVTTIPQGGEFPTSLPNYLDTFNSTLTIDFSATPISAFGFYATDAGDVASDFVVGLRPSGGTFFTVTKLLTSDFANNNNLLFWGFYDTTTTYSQIFIGNLLDGDIFGFDDMFIGDRDQILQSATPLPAALPLFATGLGALGLVAWCRKRKAALAA